MYTNAEYDLMKYKLIVDALGVAYWDMEIIDGDPYNPGNPFFCSQGFRDILDIPDGSEFPGTLQDWSESLHPDDREKALGALAAHVGDRTGRQPYNLEYRLMTKKGRYRYFHAFGSAVRNGEGVPLRLIGALEDIHDKKVMQEVIARGNDMLNAQAHWYKSILDATPLMVSVTDAGMNWTFVNKALEDFLGRKREDLIGKPCSGFNSHICGTGACSIICAKRGVKQTFFSHNGASYKADVEVIKDLNGETAGFIEVMHDITGVKAMARKQADEANAAKSIFLATMSHEMRTPLNAIIGMTAIGRKSGDADRKNYALDRIEDASAHLLGVINDVLDMSKIEANKLELLPVEFNFEQMLQKVITVITYRVNEKRQQFSVNVDSKVPRFVVGDDQRLAQVVSNLLSNAVKFTYEGGEISLDVSLLGEKNGICELRIEVADSGIGIAAAQQAKLFSAFRQAESGISREFGGTGLGLSISKRIVEMMGGRIWVESELGKGAKFIFTVKIPSGEKEFNMLLKPGINWESVRVLVVDDSPVTCKYFKGSFDQLGVYCETAGGSEEACRLIEERGAFDIYFIDWIMPGMDGIELTKWIKARDAHCVVVLMSASKWDDLKESSLNSGADKCLAKPILSSAFVDCMNECLGSAGADRGGQDEWNHEFAGKNLLFAEDIEINREIVLSLLDGTGLNIDCAENGVEALAMVEANPDKYDLVFMDMQMPAMDGLEATRRIRALHMPRNLPIVAMTANVFREDINNCIAAGMDDHIGKPLDIADVIQKLRKYLG